MRAKRNVILVFDIEKNVLFAIIFLNQEFELRDSKTLVQIVFLQINIKKASRIMREASTNFSLTINTFYGRDSKSMLSFIVIKFHKSID